ncbi:uncharacterized protein LOC144433917 [Glandiceps talaboti]
MKKLLLAGIVVLVLCLGYVLPHSSDQGHDTEHLALHLGDRFDLDEEGARHIYQHMSEMIDLPESVRMGDFDDDQGRFYMFVAHDYDQNNKLDGLECLAMLTDFYDTKDAIDAGQMAGKMSVREVETLVDDLLIKHDLNRDGYLDFAELHNPNIVSIWSKMNDYIDEVEKNIANQPMQQQHGVHQQSQQPVQSHIQAANQQQAANPAIQRGQPSAQAGQVHHQQQQAVHHQGQPPHIQAANQQQINNPAIQRGQPSAQGGQIHKQPVQQQQAVHHQQAVPQQQMHQQPPPPPQQQQQQQHGIQQPRQ